MNDCISSGDVIQDRYEIVDRLSSSGGYVLYEARQLSTHQSVTIKVLKSRGADPYQDDRVRMARFRREMTLLAKLSHPNLVRLLDCGQLSTGELFTVFDFIAGQPLSSVLEHRGHLAPLEAYRLMLQVLDALSSAHERGIVHRNITPESIMITCGGARTNAAVMNFDTAGLSEGSRDSDYEDLTYDGELVGTPLYMAPEQILREKLSPQTDIYAWALVFIECLTGERVAPTGSLIKTINFHLDPSPIELPSAVTAHPLGDLLLQATSRHPELRFANAGDALIALERVPVAGLNLNSTGEVATRMSSAEWRSAFEQADTMVNLPRVNFDF